jgi:hypothetical protein
MKTRSKWQISGRPPLPYRGTVGVPIPYGLLALVADSAST